MIVGPYDGQVEFDGLFPRFPVAGNTDSAGSYVKEMLALPNVAGAAVFDDKGKLMAGEEKNGDGVLKAEQTVVYDKQSIGKVNVYLNTAYLNALRDEDV